LRAGLEDGLAFVRMELAGLDLLGPVAATTWPSESLRSGGTSDVQRVGWMYGHRVWKWGGLDGTSRPRSAVKARPREFA
jgi:hypothetical protein